jgi:signal transduction histidine kinase
MKQVFWNLATNALKAMPGGGTLAIRVAAVEEDRVEIAFADQGKGMDEREVEPTSSPSGDRSTRAPGWVRPSSIA